MIPQPGHPKAVILIVVVCIVAVLSTLAFALAFRSRIAIKETSLLTERLQRDQLALAACAQARCVLATDNGNIDCLDEAWAGWHEIVPTQVVDQVPYRQEDSWQVSWKLIDESAKINVNLASTDLLSGLECLDEAIVASILDWIDEDDVPNPDGAENDYYSSLEPAYRCRNGPIDNIEELLLIKGMSPQIYYGTALEEKIDHLAEMSTGPAELVEGYSPDNAASLYDLLTVYGDGKVNINTASKEVLDAIPMLSDGAVSEIISTRESSIRKFSSMDDIQNNDDFTPADKLSLLQVAKFSSNHFQLHIRVRRKARPFSCEYVATVERQGRNTRLLSWQRRDRAVLKDITQFAVKKDKSVYSK